MRRSGLLACLCFAALAGVDSATSASALNIVTTTADLASIARSIGGQRVRVDSIVKGVRDPHFIEPKPSYITKVRNADLFVAIGLELEVGYERPILDGSRNKRVSIGSPGHLYASKGAKLLDIPSVQLTRKEGDVHPFGNPHIWLDPYNGRIIAQNIAAALTTLDPKGADEYKANTEKFCRQLDEKMFGSVLVKEIGADTLWRWALTGSLELNLSRQRIESKLGGWAKAMQPVAESSIIVYHRSWNYFANRFKLRIAAELEPKPGIPPSPSHIANIAEVAREKGIRVILQEPFYPTNAANLVASRSKARVVVAPSSVGCSPEAVDYFSLFDAIINAIVKSLSD